MAGGERFYIRKTIRHLTANRIVIIKLHPFRHPLLDLRHYRLESIQGLRGLGKQTDRTGKVQTIEVFYFLDNNRRAFRLAHQAIHLRMAFLSIDNQLGVIRPGLLITFMDLALQTQDDRASSVYNRDIVSLR